MRALKKTIKLHGVPEIFNTDQGSQFTSLDFTGVLLAHGVKISMDGKARCPDNVFVKRLWRSVKHEEVYLNAYFNVLEAERNLAAYFRFYNERRPHSTHDGQNLAEVYQADQTQPGQAAKLPPLPHYFHPHQTKPTIPNFPDPSVQPTGSNSILGFFAAFSCFSFILRRRVRRSEYESSPTINRSFPEGLPGI